jgi:hypothetical protein
MDGFLEWECAHYYTASKIFYNQIDLVIKGCTKNIYLHIPHQTTSH